MSDKEKAIFHGALVGVGLAELFTSQSNIRKLLIGICTGWHAYATYSHIKDMRKSQ